MNALIAHPAGSRKGRRWQMLSCRASCSTAVQEENMDVERALATNKDIVEDNDMVEFQERKTS